MLKNGRSSMNDSDRLREIGHQINTQDNRCTAHSMFLVEQLVRDWGYAEGGSDGFKWLHYEEGVEADEEKAKALEETDDRIDGDLHGWERCYYRDRWEFVTACFTKHGCEEFLNSHRHNLNNPRIYVASGYRNHEYQFIREWLMRYSNDNTGMEKTDG